MMSSVDRNHLRKSPIPRKLPIVPLRKWDTVHSGPAAPTRLADWPYALCSAAEVPRFVILTPLYHHTIRVCTLDQPRLFSAPCFSLLRLAVAAQVTATGVPRRNLQRSTISILGHAKKCRQQHHLSRWSGLGEVQHWGM